MKNLIIILILFPGFSFAQKAIKPWGIFEAGLLAGSYGPSGDLRLQGGIETKGWMFGAGLAYDGYRYETLPVYAQARKLFGNKKTKPFLMGSLGVNYEVIKDNPPSDAVFLTTRPGIMASGAFSYTPGMYADIGAGLAFRTHRKIGYNLSFSYTRKSLTEKYTGPGWNGATYETTSNETKYLMNRYAFRMAMQF